MVEIFLGIITKQAIRRGFQQKVGSVIVGKLAGQGRVRSPYFGLSFQPGDLGQEVVSFDDLFRGIRESADVLPQVRAEVVRVVGQLGEGQRVGVVEGEPASACRRNGSASNCLPFRSFAVATTAFSLGSSTASSRRITVNGRMTLPYSLCL